MPNEQIIENLVVKIGARMDEFTAAIKKAKEESSKMTEVQKKLQEEQDKLTKNQKEHEEALRRTATATQDWATKSLVAFNAIKSSNELMVGRFETTGQVMGKLGEIATAIPGPWGTAIASVLSVGGQLVDFLDRKLIKAQQAAKEGFMSIVSGAQTFSQSMRGIMITQMQEGLQRIIQEQQGAQTMAALGFLTNQEIEGTFGRFAGGFMTTPSPEATMNIFVERARSAQRLLQDLMREGSGTRSAAQELMSLEALQQTEGMAHHMRSRMARQQAFRAVHGRGAIDEDRIATLLKEAKAREMAASGIITYEEALAKLSTTKANEAFLSQAQIMVEMRTAMENNKVTEAIANQDRALAKLAIKYEGVRLAGQGVHKDEIQETTLAMKRAQEYAEMIQNRVTPALARQRMAQRETEDAIIALTERTHDAARITEHNRSAYEHYGDAVDNLTRRFRENLITREFWDRGMRGAEEALRRADPYLQEMDRFAQAGASIAHRFRDPLEAQQEQFDQLASAYSTQIINADQYRRALWGLTDQIEKQNQALRATPAVAYSSLEAMSRLDAQIDRFRARPDTTLPPISPINPLLGPRQQNPYAATNPYYAPGPTYQANNPYAGNPNPYAGNPAGGQPSVTDLLQRILDALLGRVQPLSPANLSEE